MLGLWHKSLSACYLFDSSHLLPFRFLYILYLAVDANFKLKGKECGLKDIELMLGWAYFIKETKFQEHVANYVDQPEVYFCL